jgi:surfeit locus 1 family protein
VRLGNRTFRPALWPTLAMLLLCALFLRLGVWQWQRAEYKRGLQAAYAAESALPPLSLNDAVQTHSVDTLPRYRHLSADGSYDDAHQILLQDITHDGVVGYEVLTPFVLSTGGAQVLVDRGWVAADARTSAAPAIDVSSAPRRVTVVLGSLPVPGLRLGQGAPPAAGWPKVLFYPQPADLAALYGPKLLPAVLLLDADQADGYVRETHLELGFPPERHLAYAFQWLALGLAVFIVWFWVNLRRQLGSEHERRDA